MKFITTLFMLFSFQTFGQKLNYTDVMSFLNQSNPAEVQDFLSSKKLIFEKTKTSMPGFTIYVFTGNKDYPSDNPLIVSPNIAQIFFDNSRKSINQYTYGTVEEENYLEILSGLTKDGYKAVDSFKGETDEQMPESLVTKYKNVSNTLYVEVYIVQTNNKKYRRYRVYKMV